MDKLVDVKCLNTNRYKIFPKGANLFQIAESFEIKFQNRILGALVNNEVREMLYEVYRPKNVFFFDMTHPNGMRMYVRGLIFVLFKAVKDLFPEGKLRVEHSVANGIYCQIDNISHPLTIENVLLIGEQMRLIIRQDIPFVKYEMDSNRAVEMFSKVGLEDKIPLLQIRGQNYCEYYELDDCVNSFYGPMVPSTGYLETFDLIKFYDKGMLLLLPNLSNSSEIKQVGEQKRMYEVFQEYREWNKILDVVTVGDLNSKFVNGRADSLIKVSEALHEKKIGHIADSIIAKGGVKVVLISGPSSSGKTTFSKRLAIQLIVSKRKPLTLSLDNYFVNRDDTPRDENGDYDFESLDALDLKLFNQQLVALLNGERVEIPKFSFEKGERFYDGDFMQLKEDDILIIEGIHGVNPQLTASVSDDVKFKIYVSALTSLNFDHHTRISTTDNRLIRRIVRDYKYRNYSARDTISRWPSVRKGEELHIFPFQENVDVLFNSALSYELAVLKQFAEPILLEVQPNQPEYGEARRLIRFFSYFKPLHADEIPPTSILREFLGGSSFVY